jgi:hypothetical protein
MTPTQCLLETLSEECAEVIQRVSKAQRFGLSEVQPGQPLDNAQRIAQEFNDLIGIHELLVSAGILPEINRAQVEAKKAKVGTYMAYSVEVGAVSGAEATR